MSHRQSRPAFRFVLAAGLLALAPLGALAQTTEAPDASSAEGGPEAHFQATYIWQHKPGFQAAYSGPHSLSPAPEDSYSFSATAFLGLRPWRGGELYGNFEVIQGRALSDLMGLGSPSNGENQKTSGTNPYAYVPRLFLRQTWGFGGGTEQVESDQNQLAGTRDRDRMVLTIGKLAITDVFDQNAYSHDPRTQFLTGASLAQGAFDFAADAHGYSVGAALEGYRGDWALRGGRFAVPSEANGADLTLALARYYGDQVELEHRHQFGDLPGAVRVLVFRNVANMGAFSDALAFAQANGGTPDVANVRRRQSKHGYGVHLEQALTADIGAFLRYSWSDGRTEVYSFEEVDRSAQAGVQVKGTSWHRANDTIGLLHIVNGLSDMHRAYLAQGGLGFFIGDGRINYSPEQVSEAYYNHALGPHLALAGDFQYYRNPAYNADRGPVRIYGIRVHAEF